MLNILFLNINRNNLSSLIANLVDERKIDLLILAESKIDNEKLLYRLEECSERSFYKVPGFSKLQTFVSLGKKLKPFQDAGRISLYRLFVSPGFEILIVAVHLQNKLHQNETEQIFSGVRLRQLIEKAEKHLGHSRTIVIGDFNMNPFEPGLVAADSLNAVMDRNIAERRTRIIQREKRKFFYNPLWNHFGDSKPNPPGTYYYDSGSQVNYYWNMFDQILIRPDLLNFFQPENFKIVTKIQKVSLLSGSGKPDKMRISDHLPIIFSLDIQGVL